MQPYRAVCFDFDYTLADATDSIVAGFQHGFTKMGWPAPDRETVRGTIGYLLEDAYTMLTGDSDPARRAQFRPLFLEVAKERQRRETVLFPGAEELLRALHGHGVKTAIVSTKRGDTIQAILAQQGMTLANVVKTTVFLADINDFAEMNKVYGEFFTQPYPARSAVQVAKLPKDAPLEIECIAVK